MYRVSENWNLYQEKLNEGYDLNNIKIKDTLDDLYI